MKNTIYVGEASETLKKLPDDSVDLVFADPPFNLQLRNALDRPDGSDVVAVTETWDKIGDVHAYRVFCREWLKEVGRVLKDATGSLWVIGMYHNIYLMGSVLQELGFWIRNDVIWEINNPMPNFRGTRFTNAHEILIWATPSEKTRPTFHYQALKAFNDTEKQMRSVWKLPLCQGKERLRDDQGNRRHPTQKPEALLYRVILACTNPGDLVLDPFFGSGTTGVVAKRLGRNFVGIEAHRPYVDLAQKRIRAVRRGEHDEAVLGKLKTKREQPRISVANLLELGILGIGATLYFDKNIDRSATVLANGHVRLNSDSTIGSIHQIGRRLTGSSCNGWDHWYLYEDEFIGLDELRQQARQQTEGKGDDSTR